MLGLSYNIYLFNIEIWYTIRLIIGQEKSKAFITGNIRQD